VTEQVRTKPDVRSLADILEVAPWLDLEAHLDRLRERVDTAALASHARRDQLRTEILSENPELRAKVRRPRPESMEWAKSLLRTGTVAAADGTVVAVPLLSGTKRVSCRATSGSSERSAPGSRTPPKC